MKETKKNLENEVFELLSKYSKHLPAFEIVESIIGAVTCATYSLAKRHEEEWVLFHDLSEIIKNNLKNCEKQEKR